MMSGECDNCGQHCLYCNCKWEHWKHKIAKENLNKDRFTKVVKFIFHPCLVVIPLVYFFGPLQVTLIGVMILSALLYVQE